jgi:hypothetical protein
MKNILSTITTIILLYSFLSNAQDITNTLPSGGVFKIKDNSNNFLSVDQTTGNLNLFKNIVLPDGNSGIIFKGNNSLFHTYGVNNLFLGLNSGNLTLQSGSSGNVSVGTNTLQGLTTGIENTAVGLMALHLVTNGNYNSAFGSHSLEPNTTGTNNSAFGYASLRSNTTGSNNSAFGMAALYSNLGAIANSAFGYSALNKNTIGRWNSAFGSSALKGNTTGEENSAFGESSLSSNTAGHLNSAFGVLALKVNTTGNSNTAIGSSAGSLITTGSNNIAIGYNAQVPSNTGNDQVRIGNTSISYAGIQVAWTVTSDKRWKENIQETNLGLGFISKLNPVSYTRINDLNHKVEYGLIAQEVEKVLKSEQIENTGMLTVTDEGMYELRYNDLLAPMIKAIQELKAENEKLRIEKDKEVAQLKTENLAIRQELESFNELSLRLAKLEQEIKNSDVKFTSNDVK